MTWTMIVQLYSNWPMRREFKFKSSNQNASYILNNCYAHNKILSLIKIGWPSRHACLRWVCACDAYLNAFVRLRGVGSLAAKDRLFLALAFAGWAEDWWATITPHSSTTFGKLDLTVWDATIPPPGAPLTSFYVVFKSLVLFVVVLINSICAHVTVRPWHSVDSRHHGDSNC